MPAASQTHPAFLSTSAPPALRTTSATTRGHWSTSDKYVRFEVREKEKFERISRRHATNESRSPFLPTTWQEYLTHRADFLDDRIAAGKTEIAAAEAQAQARKSNPASAVVVPVFGGRNLMGMAACPLEDYRKWQGRWWPIREDVAAANRKMDSDASFRRRGEFLVGEDLVKRL